MAVKIEKILNINNIKIQNKIFISDFLGKTVKS